MYGSRDHFQHHLELFSLTYPCAFLLADQPQPLAGIRLVDDAILRLLNAGQ